MLHQSSFLQVLLVKRCTFLGGLTEEIWSKEHDLSIKDFLTDPNLPLLLLHIDQTTGDLCISNGIPPSEVEQASYFVRGSKVEVSVENFHQVLRIGLIHGNCTAALLRVMQGIYAPNFFENRVWPDSILAPLGGCI